ncbi:YrhC family protein [Bacillus sp. DJP31]|uniref:YrhC family protein n=1 Tax=Bacillus sp. DJP31 TaxID=3409789 RepID=UPI003BB61C40
MNPKFKDIQDKVADYSRFGMVLLAVSVFLFIGILIPDEGKSIIQTYVMMASTVVFLAIAFYFFKKTIQYKKALSELDEEM